MPALRRAISLLVLAIAICGGQVSLWAHLTPNSEVRLAFERDQVRATVIIPLGDYALATGNPVTNDSASIARARAYLAQHIAVRGEDGTPWSLRVDSAQFVQVAGPPDLRATLHLIPPDRKLPEQMTLAWSAIVDAVPGHFAMVIAEPGASDRLLGAQARVLGTVNAERRLLQIRPAAPSRLSAFVDAFNLGAHHIAIGHDHLLFLIMLLVPAPLIAANGRWREVRPVRRTLAILVGTVTAFTIGHSLTLVGATFWGWRLPAQPIEVLIALSILISAIHVARPLFPGREAWVAMGFGLIHGLAFATIVQDYDLDRLGTASAILGFNLGIEAVQLLVVSVLMPSLILLARTRHYGHFRLAAAAIGAMAATIWIHQRLAGTSNPVAEVLDQAFALGPFAIAVLTVVALVLRKREPARSGQERGR
ncbi:HupE/UreJ family protein [Sphingomonas sp. CJ99]